MAAKWEHPKLGRFKYDGTEWIGTVDAPGFDAFAYDTGDDDEQPVVELCFWAAFEEEHNVGVLTDGRKVLGTGYHLDVTPFETE